ncbi:chemotaxis protein histidine kinase-like protein [Opitutaceae bacterium TAV1]|nr:chemotaxis protein histidine kinase-like protein [Opitutaceae bacterium TAV1]
MSLSSDTLASLDDLCSRLAGESVLARAGNDDGLIPVFSLVGEMREAVAGVSRLENPLKALQALLGARLDGGLPFDEATLAEVRRIAEWLPGAIAAAAGGDDDGKVAAAAGEDRLLELNLAENRELLSEFHAEALDHLLQIEAALLTLDTTPGDRDALDSLFRSFHTLKGVSGFLHLAPMHTLTHEVESLLDRARTGKLRLTPEIITEILRSRDAVQAMVGQITAALEDGREPGEAVRVSHLIDAVRRLAAGGDRPDADTPPAPEPAEQRPPANDPAASSPAASGNAQANGSGGANGAAVASTVRVNTEKLDSLMDVVGELVIVQSQLQESSRGPGGDGSPLARNLAQLGRITKDLQHTAMALRMVPIKPMFQRIGRLVRDLSRECDKRVQFVTAGEDTEIDRSVVEEIVDPLVHMVRNAIDHGLEPAAERAAAGKDEAGRLSLKAFHEGSHLVIELADDGRGIDPEKVLAKARRQGLVGESESLAREKIIDLIFLPGFSTAEKVSAVSGRGVGMDVVRRNIEKLGGQIQIVSEVGGGSRFAIRLPLTTAIIDGLLVRVGEDHFILPSLAVQMALRPARAALATIQGQGEVLDHRGKILPLHRLHRRFAIRDAVEDPAAGIVVILEDAGRARALLVDELVNKQEVVVKNLGSFLQNLPGVAGGAILGDGNIALILDPASLCAA